MKMYLLFFCLLLIGIFNSSDGQFQKSEIGNQKPDTGDKTLSPYFLVQSENPEIDQMPLLSTSAEVNIAGVIADVTVKQAYKNSGKNALEAIYVFPASTRAAVYGMRMKIGSRTIIAKIEKREEARQQYEQAKKEGKSASLLEQQRPNVFQMNVANIMPGDLIEVELKYNELLVPTDGVYEFSYPTVVGPRYSNKPKDKAKPEDTFVESPYQKKGEKPSYTFDMSVNLQAGVPLDEVECTSHKVNISKSENSANIKLDESEKFGGNKDFILKYRLTGGKINTGLLLSQQRQENFFLLMIQPPKSVQSNQILKREYIFIMDVSGSMIGYPLDLSKKLINGLIGKMKPEEKFNILLFSGGSSVLSETSLSANQENLAKANELISKQKGGGGTELLPALKRALALPKEEGFSRTIVIATDGYVDIEEEAMDLIKNSLDKSNLFAFGIGRGVNRFLIEGLARAGNGEPFIIPTEKDANEKVEKFRSYIESPVLTDIQVEYDGFKVYDVEPMKVPDVFAQRPIIIFGKWKTESGNEKSDVRTQAGGQIKISGLSGGNERLNVTIPVAVFASEEKGDALKYLWARHKLASLSDYNTINNREENKNLITKIGIDYNLLTKFTSFIAVDSEIRNKDGKQVSVKQPLPLPEGVENEAVGGAAPLMMRSAMSVNKSYKMELKSDNAEDISLIHGSKNTTADTVEEAFTEQYPEINAFNPVKKEPQYNEKEIYKNLEYPEAAKKAGIEGKVIIRVLITKDGKLKKSVVEYRDHESFVEPAKKAVEKLKFEPAINSRGKKVSAWISVTVKFKLEEEKTEGKIRVLGKMVKLTETKSGLKYYDEEPGSGVEVRDGLKITVDLRAYKDDGTAVKSNTIAEETFTFRVGDLGIIKGLDEGIIGMKVGGVRYLVIPPKLQSGTKPNIAVPDEQNLILEVYLQEIR
jgi:Ca-activated chloride channel homolog